ncbi:hypothetical protein ACLB2K_010975 [Fragaria x ananassa]
MRLSISGSGEYLIGSKNSIKAELCSYCFRHSSSGDCFSCRQCKRRVHWDCDSEYRSSTVWSGSSSVAAAEEVSVCGDCWVSESLARWRRSRNSSGGAGRKNNRADLGVGRARVSDDERKCDSDSVAVCDYSSTEEVRCLRLDAVEEEEEEEEAEENVDDDDGQWLVSPADLRRDFQRTSGEVSGRPPARFPTKFPVDLQRDFRLTSGEVSGRPPTMTKITTTS